MLCESTKCIQDASQKGIQKRRDPASFFHGGVQPEVDLTKRSWVFFPLPVRQDSQNIPAGIHKGAPITQSGSSVHGTGRPQPKFHSTFQIHSTTEIILISAGQRRADLCQRGGHRADRAPRGGPEEQLGLTVISEPAPPTHGVRGHQKLGEVRAGEFRGGFEACQISRPLGEIMG